MCCWLVCSVSLWHFLVIKNLLFEQVLPDLIDGAPDVISQALLSAPVWGNEQVNGFVCSRLMQNPAKFDDSIKQNGHVLFHQYTK